MVEGKEVWRVLTQPIGKPVVRVQEEAWVEGSPRGKRSTQPSSDWNNPSIHALSRALNLYLQHNRSGVFEKFWSYFTHLLGSHEFSGAHESLASWHILTMYQIRSSGNYRSRSC